MGELETPSFHDFGISGRVHDSQNQYYLSLETPGYIKQFKKMQKSFQKTCSRVPTCWKSNVLKMLENGHRTHMKSNLNIFENLKYGINSFQKHDICSDMLNMRSTLSKQKQ